MTTAILELLAILAGAAIAAQLAQSEVETEAVPIPVRVDEDRRA